MYFRLKIVVGLLLAVSLSSNSFGQWIPANKDVTDGSLLSLGPIGVRVKTDHLDDYRPKSKSSSGTVKYVFENSLAQDALQLGDVITGVNGVSFDKDFSDRIAEAIATAEAGDGELVLNLERSKEKMAVSLRLDKKGTYSQNWPYQCSKSSQILHDACDWLVAHQLESGRVEAKRAGTAFVLSSVSGLAMLGCDAEKYQEPIKKIVEFELEYLQDHVNQEGHYQNGKLELWSLNYAAMFLSEYYLVSQDPKVLPVLEFLNQEIHFRQFRQSSDQIVTYARDHLKQYREKTKTRPTGDETKNPLPGYWFGHGKITPKSSGYLHLGINAANACVAWSLLEEAGIDVDRENLTATKDYIQKVAPSGCMTYLPTLGQRAYQKDSFGRTGTLGVALHLDNDRPQYTLKVSSALKKLQPRTMYYSHASCVMGKAWGLMAIANLDPQLFREVMDEHRDDFELLRLSDGSFASNPAQKNRHGDQDLKFGGNQQKHRWTTAFNALIYAIGEQRLRITGRKPNATQREGDRESNETKSK